MEINILSNKEEKLFERSSIVFFMEYKNQTPSKEEAKVALCKKANLRPDFTVITSIEQAFGSKSCKAYAHSYSSKEALDRYERKHLLKRLEKQGAAGPAKEEAEKAEKPATGEVKEEKE